MRLPRLPWPQKKPIRIQGIEYKHAPALRALSLVVILTLLLMITVAVVFVYQHVTHTLTSIQSIILLQSELRGAQPIDFHKLERVEAAWTKKHATPTLEIKRDPFN